jgi:hypothetical protein
MTTYRADKNQLGNSWEVANGHSRIQLRIQQHKSAQKAHQTPKVSYLPRVRSHRTHLTKDSEQILVMQMTVGVGRRGNVAVRAGRHVALSCGLTSDPHQPLFPNWSLEYAPAAIDASDDPDEEIVFPRKQTST